MLFCAKSLQSCLTLCGLMDDSPPGSFFYPWDSPGKNTGVGYHFLLLQCMKVKSESESEFVQSCLTRSDPMDCSLPGSFVHGIFQARIQEWGACICLLQNMPLELINKYCLVTGYKINIKKTLSFLHTNKKKFRRRNKGNSAIHRCNQKCQGKHTD